MNYSCKRLYGVAPSPRNSRQHEQKLCHNSLRIILELSHNEKKKSFIHKNVLMFYFNDLIWVFKLNFKDVLILLYYKGTFTRPIKMVWFCSATFLNFVASNSAKTHRSPADTLIYNRFKAGALQSSCNGTALFLKRSLITEGATGKASQYLQCHWS